MSQSTELIQNVFLSLSIVIGDSMIIHRLWVVWIHSRLVVVFPICSLLLVTTFSVISDYTSMKSGSVLQNKWLIFNPSFSLITNIYCTGPSPALPSTCDSVPSNVPAFIAWKIWNTTKLSMSSGGSKLRHFVIVVVESAGIYAFWAACLVVTFQARSNVQSIVLQTAPGVVGIVNALIHTRVSLGWTSEQSQAWPSSSLRFADQSAAEAG
ncbi:hypothetical protein B0H10DRAFT_1177897 [Mycena sp. CBHHK59/15]|nr:hypothetical protein B0H10DRAFT_1177897 [Mycena sp. CBHHK59/15]